MKTNKNLADSNNKNSSIAAFFLGVLFVFLNTTFVMQVHAQSVVSSINNNVVEWASLRDDGTKRYVYVSTNDTLSITNIKNNYTITSWSSMFPNSDFTTLSVLFRNTIKGFILDTCDTTNLPSNFALNIRLLIKSDGSTVCEFIHHKKRLADTFSKYEIQKILHKISSYKFNVSSTSTESVARVSVIVPL